MISDTHRWKAPGVWLPKETTPACAYSTLIGPVLQQCGLAVGHEGDHADSRGNPLPSNFCGGTAGEPT